MRNKLLVAVIIIAAIFPFAATAFELDNDLMAMVVLGVLSVIGIGITATAILIKAKPSAEAEIPVQAIPTIKNAAGPTAEGKANPEPVRPATDASAKPEAGAKPEVSTKPEVKPAAAATKPDAKRQRVR